MQQENSRSKKESRKKDRESSKIERKLVIKIHERLTCNETDKRIDGAVCGILRADLQAIEEEHNGRSHGVAGQKTCGLRTCVLSSQGEP